MSNEEYKEEILRLLRENNEILKELLDILRKNTGPELSDGGECNGFLHEHCGQSRSQRH